MYWMSFSSCGITFRKMFIRVRALVFRRAVWGLVLFLGVFTAHAAPAQEPAPTPEDAPTKTEEPTLAPVVVTAPPPVSASSEVFIPGRDFELRPQGRPADVLRLVPGLVISQHQGGG